MGLRIPPIDEARTIAVLDKVDMLMRERAMGRASARQTLVLIMSTIMAFAKIELAEARRRHGQGGASESA